MKINLLILWLILSTTTCLFSQDSKRTNIWYFGRKAGIDFNTTPPTPMLDGALDIWEGCATICDTSGELIMYTDGRNIWNKNHQIIPGATDLGGSNSATQSGIIVPFPNSDNLFYVFSVDASGGNGGLRYAEVDITLNGGLGGLVSSNNILLDRCSEKVTAISHCNKQNFWLVAHEYGNNNFVVWEITNSGISSSYISSIGSIHSASSTGVIGYMKGSPDGSHLALGVYEDNFFEVFDFDNKTGNISNPINFNESEFNNPYGVEFSPDGTRLYIAGTQSNPILFQVNLDLPTIQEIQNSIIIVAQGSSGYFGAIQNAPNGKIYVAKDNSKYLSVIHNPNELGSGCDFVEDDFYLEEKRSALGLPNIIPSFFAQEPIIELLENTNSCNDTSTIQAITDIEGDNIIFQWYFNNELIPNQASTQIPVNLSGIYEFKVTVYFECQENPSEYSQQINISFPDKLNIDNIQLNPPFCGLDNGSISILESGGSPPYEYSIDGINFQESENFTNLAKGLYTIAIRDSKGCTDTTQLEISPENPPSITDIDITQTSCGEDNGAILIKVTGGTDLEYSIDELSFQDSGSFENLSPGSYTIIVRGSNNCQDTQLIILEPSEFPIVQPVEGIPTSCGKPNGSIRIEVNDENFEFSINDIDYQIDNVFSNLDSGNYTVLVKDENGCISKNEVEVESSPKLVISSVESISTNCGEVNGGLLIDVEGSTGLIQTTLNGDVFQSKFSFDNLSSGEYDIQIIDEANCLIDTLLVINQKECPINIPSAFSPNNDGFNDLFKIYPHPNFTGEFKSFKVFDRWGTLLYETQNFNPFNVGWNGTYNEKELDIGVYVYSVEYISDTGDFKIIKGNVTIIR